MGNKKQGKKHRKKPANLKTKQIYISSNINEFIKTVLNFLFYFFHDKILRAQKAQKGQKEFKATKSTKSTKSTKKHKKYKNANKRISDFFPFRCFLCA